MTNGGDKFEIEKDIPVPSRMRSSEVKYPFATMAVGDSFAVDLPADKKDVRRQHYRFIAAIRARRKVSPRERYTTRVVLENEKRRLRIWRDADALEE